VKLGICEFFLQTVADLISIIIYQLNNVYLPLSGSFDCIVISGVAATSVNNKLPNLVNLNEDPQLSEILLYLLEEGETKVGRQGASQQQQCDIQLSGALVSDYHWLVGCILFSSFQLVSIVKYDWLPIPRYQTIKYRRA